MQVVNSTAAGVTGCQLPAQLGCHTHWSGWSGCHKQAFADPSRGHHVCWPTCDSALYQWRPIGIKQPGCTAKVW